MKSPQVITANRLKDGDVVYLTPENKWSEKIDDAIVARSDEDIAAFMTIAKQAIKDLEIIDPYEFDVEHSGKELKPISMREIIRAAGPTIRRDLGKQASKE